MAQTSDYYNLFIFYQSQPLSHLNKEINRWSFFSSSFRNLQYFCRCHPERVLFRMAENIPFCFSHTRPNNQSFEPKFALGLFRSILLWELSHFKSKRKLKLHLITPFSNSLTGNFLGWNGKGYIIIDASSRLASIVHPSSSTHQRYRRTALLHNNYKRAKCPFYNQNSTNNRCNGNALSLGINGSKFTLNIEVNLRKQW